MGNSFWECIEHFSPEEFSCPCCGKNNIRKEVVKRLDFARSMAGVPFVITSGCRCEKHNAEVGGKPDSAHLNGWAIDIECSMSFNRYKIILSLLTVGFNRIGIAKGFIHADIDPTKPKPVIWVY